MRASRLMLSLLLSAGLGACAGVEMTPAEKEIAETLGTEAFQPATRDLRDSIETQDLLSQASFWSREYQLNPGDLEAAIKLAAVVRRMGNPGRAVEITQTTRALYPKDPYLVAEYAAALIASERGAEALPVVEQAIQWQPTYARLWSLRGAALDQAERYPEARASYQKALSITPYDPNILANLGLSHALEGDAETAEMWLERAVAIPGASETVRGNLDLVRQLRGAAPVSSTQQAAAPAPQAPQHRTLQQEPQSRLQVMDPTRGNALSAARQMRAPQHSAPQTAHQAAPQTAPEAVFRPAQPSPVRAGDANALERLARNASPHTRSTSPFAQQAQRQSMQQQAMQRQMPQQGVTPQGVPPQGVPPQGLAQQQRPQPVPQQAPTGYQPLPGYPLPQGYAPQGYAPQGYAPRQMSQSVPQLRGPKRPRR